nr:ankyrin repeat domain-containing protein [Geobacteraceae bacterium]
LLENGCTVDARDRDGHTPLMFASNYGCNECITCLVEYGADPNAKTLCGNTALTYAETNDHPETLALLVKLQRAKQAV